MIDKINKEYKPNYNDLCEYIKNYLFICFTNHLFNTYQAKYEIMYSGDQILLGWNIRIYKGNRTLCRLYPNIGWFKILVVVGKKEKERVENILPTLSKEFNDIYISTKEGMNQRWLLIDIYNENELYNNVLQIIEIRSKSK